MQEDELAKAAEKENPEDEKKKKKMESVVLQKPRKVFPKKYSTKLLHSYQTLSTLWTVACHAPLSMGFSKQEYCSGLPCPSPGDLPHPGTELSS